MICGYTCLVSFALMAIKVIISGLAGMIYLVASVFDLCLIIPLGVLGMFYAIKGRIMTFEADLGAPTTFSPRSWIILIGVLAALGHIIILFTIGTCPVPGFLCNPISPETFVLILVLALLADTALIIAGALFRYPNALQIAIDPSDI